MNRPKFHKLYFPGLISLVFLPVMCICYLIRNNIFHKYHAMTVAWESKESLKEWMKFSHKKINIETFRNYQNLSLTGNPNHDMTEQIEMKTLIKQLIHKTDTLNGVCISFGSHTRYDEIIDVLDICYQYQAGNDRFNFVPYNNKVLMYYMAPIKGEKMDYACLLCNDVLYIKPKEPFISIEKIKAGMVEAYKLVLEYWPSIIIFMLMLGFTVYKTRRYFNLKTFHFSGN
jgi:hypothetical protein